jgi:hypothetical protein
VLGKSQGVYLLRDNAEFVPTTSSATAEPSTTQTMQAE